MVKSAAAQQQNVEGELQECNWNQYMLIQYSDNCSSNLPIYEQMFQWKQTNKKTILNDLTREREIERESDWKT